MSFGAPRPRLRRRTTSFEKVEQSQPMIVSLSSPTTKSTLAEPRLSSGSAPPNRSKRAATATASEAEAAVSSLAAAHDLVSGKDGR